jgi:hypothetical protein
MQTTVPVVLERVLDHLPISHDPTLMILRGHLLVEEQLNAAVALRVAEPKYLVDARLEFDQLLCIAKAIYFKTEHSWVWGGIKKLNLLRNLLAHNLNPPNLDAKANELVKHVEDHVGRLPGSRPNRLRGSIGMLAAQILVYRELHEV